MRMVGNLTLVIWLAVAGFLAIAAGATGHAVVRLVSDKLARMADQPVEALRPTTAMPLWPRVLN